MSNFVIVYNPASGSADLDAIKKAFTEHGVTPVYVPISSSSLSQTLGDITNRADTTIVAAGGDGTINTVAQHLHNTVANLGIIPVGTLNHFAKALGIPLDISKAVKVIMNNKHSHVDVGIVNDRVFVNNSSIGFYPHSLLVRDEYGKRIGKWPAAFIGFIRAAIRPRHYRVEIVLDGKQETLRTPFVFIGNNEYLHSPPNVGERKTLTSGKIAVYVVKATTIIGVVRLLSRALFRRAQHTDDLSMYLTDACTIRTRYRRRIHVACDGEVLSVTTPLKYRSEHNALRVVTP